MGYSTDFEGSIQVKRRTLLFSLQFTENNEEGEEEDIDLEPTKQSLCHIDRNSFEKVILFAFLNEQTSTLHYFRLISKNFYCLCATLNQNRLFSRVDSKTVALINGLATSRRMIRYRFINGIDYGMDGQYYIDTDNFGQNYTKYNTFYDGLPINSSQPPRTQPSLWMQWTFNEEKQCIEWDGGEKFYYYVEWLIYLINNILHSQYALCGNIQWKGQDPDDTGEIIIENDGQNIVKTVPEDIWNEDKSKSKEKNIIYGGYTFSWIQIDETIGKSINDKTWIENHKTLTTYNELKEALASEKAENTLKRKQEMNDGPPPKKFKPNDYKI
eukprot:601436_1